MIEVFKILIGREGIQEHNLFERNSTESTRGHIHKLYLNYSRLNIRKSFFSQRTVIAWNNLPLDVVSATSINTFKNRIDKHIKRTYGVVMDAIPLTPLPRPAT